MATEQPPVTASERVDQQVAETLGQALAAGLATEALINLAGRLLAPLRIARKAIRAAWENLKETFFSPPPSEGYAGEKALKDAWLYRGWFWLNSARRIQLGLSQGVPLADLLATERRHAEAHSVAQRNRVRAAREADAAAHLSVINGANLSFVWWTQQDDRVSKDCKELHGKIYPIDAPPQGIYPGAMHPFCRCESRPVPAMVAQARRVFP